MRCTNLRLLLVGGALLSMAACATSRVWADWSGPPIRVVAAARTTRIAWPLLAGPQDGAVATERGRRLGPVEDAPLPDIAGRWMGTWSGYGVIARRTSKAEAEFIQAGRWGWGRLVLADTLAADVPVIVSYRGALGVPVVFDVFQTSVVVKHEAGGGHLTAIFKIDGDRLVGMLRGHATLIVLARQR
ncbi:MAG: hypothetical protein DMD99_23760 [Candidatus Rokuibacteriota bacterium]|nr:MAG: hypothetical protein DMD99_23760 [Candidatus Rokubacteria bacterium]